MVTKKITIKPNGEMKFVYDDKLRSLLGQGDATIRRASHVEPTDDGKWTADMSPVAGPVLGPFDTREEALREEVKWLDAHMSTIPTPAAPVTESK